MLKSLRIKNYALIHELDLRLEGGLLIITGETGAGKSILLGALGLVIGERADSSVVEGHASKCVVEAEFDVSAYGLKPFFEEHELDYESFCILRREISVQGKSRAFINDTPVSIQQLKELGEQLIDIHTQHETLSLKDRSYQVQLVDAFAQNAALLREYRSALQKRNTLKKQLDSLLARESDWKSEYDFNLFQFRELKDADLKEGEESELEIELERLEHAADIARTAFEGAEGIKNSDGAALVVLRMLEHQLGQQSKVEPRFESLKERLRSVNIELDDLAAELDDIAQNTQADENRQQLVSERLDRINGLLKKHRCTDSATLISRMYELEDLTAKVESIEEEKAKLQVELDESATALEKAATALRESRQKAAPGLVSTLGSLLAEVGMPNTRMQVEQVPREHYGPDGPDEISLLFSSNPGAPLQPVNKVASGGELSRLMLCFKSVLAESLALPTLIFDEIDTGISGEVASRVGQRMRKLSVGHQVVCITHLPQIAGCGDAHFRVYKEVNDNQTRTQMIRLTDAERVEELAKMLSGDRLSDSAIANAKELLRAN